MASTVKFDTWQNTAGELIADTAAGARLPLSGNAIINGDFGVWQRGTSFGPDTTNRYAADRWYINNSGATSTVSRQSFTPGDIEAVGYGDAEYFLRMDVTTGDNNAGVQHFVEDVHTFAGQIATVSFWAKGTNPGAGNFKLTPFQNFGSGGSSSVLTSDTDITVTSSWQRFTFTFDVPSVSGKTIGDGSYLAFFIRQDTGDASTDAWTLDLWGVQLEAGSVATPFRLAGGGSKGAELALCQRYYWRSEYISGTSRPVFGYGHSDTATDGYATIEHPVEMRDKPSLLEFSSLEMGRFSVDAADVSALSLSRGTTKNTTLYVTTSQNMSSGGVFYYLTGDGTGGYVALGAEL